MPNRLLVVCTAALLGTWCVFGGLVTAKALLSEEEGWYYARSDAAAGVVGMATWWRPEDITTLRSILAQYDRTDGVPWLVLYPSDIPHASLQYIRAQLAYHEYPLRVDVIREGSALPAEHYAGVITPPTLELSDSGEPVLSLEGFRIYPEKRR